MAQTVTASTAGEVDAVDERETLTHTVTVTDADTGVVVSRGR